MKPNSRVLSHEGTLSPGQHANPLFVTSFLPLGPLAAFYLHPALRVFAVHAGVMPASPRTGHSVAVSGCLPGNGMRQMDRSIKGDPHGDSDGSVLPERS